MMKNGKFFYDFSKFLGIHYNTREFSVSLFLTSDRIDGNQNVCIKNKIVNVDRSTLISTIDYNFDFKYDLIWNFCIILQLIKQLFHYNYKCVLKINVLLDHIVSFIDHHHHFILEIVYNRI